MSFIEANRRSSSRQKLSVKKYNDLTGYDSTAAFIVTGDVWVKVTGVVGDVAITSTSGTTVLSLGTAGAVQSIIANSTVDNAQFATSDVWVDSAPTVNSKRGDSNWVMIGTGANIFLTRSVDDITGGKLVLYCEWVKASTDARVVPTA